MMLALARKQEMSVWIGEEIRVQVLKVQGKKVVLGVDAPAHLRIWREELLSPNMGRCGSAPSEGMPTPDRGSFRVIVIEDETSHARMIQKALGDGGISSVEVIRSGEEAMQFLDQVDSGKAARPNLVLLDLGLPGVSGLEVLKAIRAFADLATTPTVVLSSSSHEADVSLSLKLGANAFVPKTRQYSEFRKSILRIADFWAHTSAA